MEVERVNSSLKSINNERKGKVEASGMMFASFTTFFKKVFQEHI